MIKFGTGGFRGVIGVDFTKENVQRTAQALSQIIKKENSTKPVIVGYDKRFLSDHFAKWFAEVLAGNGVQVLLFDRPIPTPLVMFGTMKDGNDYGVMITASHNPYEYNGIKIFVKEGRDADVAFTNLLEKETRKKTKIKVLDFNTAIKNNAITNYDNMKDYINNIGKFLSKKPVPNKSSVLYNVMFGVAGEGMQILAKKQGIKNFKMINTEHDAFFNFSMPSPFENTLQDFIAQVKKGYDFGLACDGDGDRLGLVDNKGIYYNCNHIMAIIYYYLIVHRNQKGDIVKNIASSVLLDRLAKRLNFVCHEVPVGFKYVSASMKETDALVGGESSGGLTVRGYINGKDSLFASALLMEVQAVMGKPMKDIIDEIEKFAGYTYTFIEKSFVLKNKKNINRALSKDSPAFPLNVERVNTIDGYKYYFEADQWALIRFSGTEPLLRVVTECKDKEMGEKITAAIEEFINKYE